MYHVNVVGYTLNRWTTSSRHGVQYKEHVQVSQPGTSAVGEL